MLRSENYDQNSITILDLTGGLFLVTSDQSKPRLTINLDQNAKNEYENQITIEINSKINDETLFNIINTLNSSIRSLKYQWEVCSLLGEVLEDNYSNRDIELSKLLITKIVTNLPTIMDEIKVNYSFSLNREELDDKSGISISSDEEKIIILIENRSTRSIQSGMLKKDPKFETYSKLDILSVLRSMVDKEILVRSGSWFFLKKS